MLRIAWTSLIVVLLLVGALPLAPASSSTVRLHYDGAAPLGFSSPAEECSGKLPRSLGVVCLTLPANARALAFAITDKSSLSVGGSYYVYDAAGNFATMGSHCGGASFQAPSRGLVIVRMELINGPLVCLSEGNTATGEATKGFVTFTVN